MFSLNRIKIPNTLIVGSGFLLNLMFCSLTAMADESSFTVKRQSVYDMKSLFAVVQTVDVTQGRARIGGLLVELLVDEGDTVVAGQKIARVQDVKQKLQIAAYGSKLRSLEARLHLAESTLTRINRLFERGKISEANLDEAQTEVNVISADIAEVKADQAVVRESQIEGDVLAPAGGRVLNVNVTRGTVVLRGEAIAEIAAESYILRLMLPERHARFIKRGDSVLVGERGMLDAGFVSEDDVSRQGTIYQVYPELDNGRVVADVTVDDIGDFFVGERVRVWVSAGARQAFIIPLEYMHRRYGLSFVRLASGVEVVIQPGLEIEGGIEILSGLREGDVLVREPSQVENGNSRAGE
jgi:RND family efflux transporter MFP subunit